MGLAALGTALESPPGPQGPRFFGDSALGAVAKQSPRARPPGPSPAEAAGPGGGIGGSAPCCGVSVPAAWPLRVRPAGRLTPRLGWAGQGHHWSPREERGRVRSDYAQVAGTPRGCAAEPAAMATVDRTEHPLPTTRLHAAPCPAQPAPPQGRSLRPAPCPMSTAHPSPSPLPVAALMCRHLLAAWHLGPGAAIGCWAELVTALGARMTRPSRSDAGTRQLGADRAGPSPEPWPGLGRRVDSPVPAPPGTGSPRIEWRQGGETRSWAQAAGCRLRAGHAGRTRGPVGAAPPACDRQPPPRLGSVL